MTLTTVEEVRRTSGVTSSLVVDDDVTATIVEAEAQLEEYLNVDFTPRERLDTLDGSGTDTIKVMRNPLMALKELRIDGTEITIDGNVFVSKESGILTLNSKGTPEETRFKGNKKSINITYIHGWMKESRTRTTLSSASSPGSSVALSVGSEQGFAANEWVEIYGMDGNRESAKITAVATNQITVDNLSFSHENGSAVVKLEVNEVHKKLMRIVSSIALVLRVVGESFDDIVGYSMGEFQVQKGEPYTQWRETATQLIRERDEILLRVPRRPIVL